MQDQATRRRLNAIYAANHSDRREAANAKVLERNRAVIAVELERRGGTCVYPGCKKTTIEWHHRDPETKNFEIQYSVRRHTAATRLAELALCDPLCRKHHMAVDGRAQKAAEFMRSRAWLA